MTLASKTGLLGLTMVAMLIATTAQAAGVKTVADVPYKEGENLSDYEKERCKLDLYLPEDATGFATIVYFHGGGLTAGSRSDVAPVARSFAKGGVAVATPNYRFSKTVKFPAYMDDAAASVAWVIKHISDYGGDPKRVFVMGHSAGGYLAMMVGFDGRYLAAYDLKTDAIAGLINISGQLFTHTTVREERGIANARAMPTIDDAAPASYARADAPPILMFYADDDMPMRGEECEYFAKLLQYVGHQKVQCVEITERNHVTVGTQMENFDDPARALVMQMIEAK